MKTAYKMFIAKSLLRLISYFSSDLNVNCTRNKINWTLDLNEGIDLSIFIFGKFEYEIIKTVEKLHLDDNSNSSILDIGANIGIHSLQLANNFKNIKIYAIEPTDFAFNKLIVNLKNNKYNLKNIFPRQVFLTNISKYKPKKIYSSWDLITAEHTHKEHLGVKKSLNNAISFSLDNFIKKNNIANVKLIKLDVDGYELQVLTSGKNLLKKKPFIIMELAPYLYPEFGYNQIDLIKLIKSFGYTFYSINPIRQITDIEGFARNINQGSSKNILIK